MKKLFIGVVSFLALFTVAGCSNETADDLLDDTKDVYAFEAISSTTLLKSMSSESTKALMSVKSQNYSYSNLGYTDEVTEEEIDEINKYLGIMEQMLADDEPITVVDEASDRSEYTNMLVISTKDINLNVHTYTLYFNEEVITDEEELEESEESQDEDDKDEEEVEVSSTLEGIMVIDGIEYVVNGKKEVEEDEVKVEFTSKIDEQNWVTVKQKTEEDETKFEYTISENGVVSVTEMKFEQEDNETKLKLEFVQGENKNEYQFKIEEEDGQKVIKIEINDGNQKLEVKVYLVVDPTTGETSYEYKIKDSEKSFKKDREIDKDDDENEEDDEEEQDEE